MRPFGFIVEGKLALRRAGSGALYRLASVFVAETRVAALAAVLSGLAPEVAVYTAPQAVMDAVCGYPVHRGVLAHGLEPPPRGADALLASLADPAVVLGLIGLNDPENLGSILRNAAGFGAHAVLLDPSCCDPLSRRAIRVSVGAALIVPFARLGAGETMVDVLAQGGFDVLAFTPRGETRLDELSVRPRVALLFGAEGPGLPDSVLAAARTVRIPMAPGFDSLNVATASAVALHHLVAGRNL